MANSNSTSDKNRKLMKKELLLQRNCDMTELIDYLWKHKCSEEFSTKPFAKDAPKENWVFTYKTYPCPRFGGICHNESKAPILIYNGNGALGNVDKTMASIESLRFDKIVEDS
ncbi:hypothetical protein ACH5RR_022679 [Cinchona calisaya]|uniref:Uncharacterized protein n=1 Tax=Cinchona calisaya TaxID=153742 RepID=A0ABD2ZCE4_9GENT